MKFFLFLLFLIQPFLNGQAYYCLKGKIISNTNSDVSQISVLEKNSGTGTITNSDGTFFLRLKEGQNLIHVFDKNVEPIIINLYLKKDTSIQINVEFNNIRKNKKSVL